MIEQTYPSGRVVKNVLDANGDLEIVQSKKDSASGYWNYAENFTYNAASAVTSMQLGNGKWESIQFNSRLQPTQIALGATPNATNLLKLDYEYGATAAVNNGNVTKQTITVPTVGANTGFTAVQSYQYDSLNRLKDATEMVTPQGGSQSQSWRQAFTFDRYGNRNFDESLTTTRPKSCGTPPNQTVCPADVPKVNPSVNPLNNRFSSGQGWSYDAAGNTTADPEGRQFTYDAENKQVKVETLDANGNPVNTIGVYEHDGDGRRVKKIVPGTGEVTVFVYDAASKLVAEYSTQAASTQDAKVAYLTNDHLGSPRINTDANGAVTARHDYHPFGEEVFTAQRTQGLNYAGDSVRQKFTSYERDNETDLDFAQARYYNKLYGRFTSPDEAFIDQFEENPQSWNLYIYVRNNPLNLTDPLGTSANCPPGKVCTLDEDGNVISEEDDNDPIIIETTAPRCSPNNPCHSDLPDSWQDWIPVWGSFRQIAWNMRCRERGGCDVGKALGYFGMTALELTPVGVATKGLKGAQAAPSILQTLCFEEGTLVLTDVGLKPIEDIREGDQVLSYNENTKQTEFKIVVQTFERVAEAGRILSVSVEGETAPLGVTREHPFYVRIHLARDNTSSEDDDGEWIEAGKLRIGDEIRRANGDWAKVESVTQRNDGAKVYNFEVADNHNYFVGQTHLLAHNTCFLSARELAIRLNVTEREFHRKIKRQILNKAREAVNELRSRNPDIGISEKGTIVIRDPRNRSRSIDTGISFDDFVQ